MLTGKIEKPLVCKFGHVPRVTQVQGVGQAIDALLDSLSKARLQHCDQCRFRNDRAQRLTDFEEFLWKICGCVLSSKRIGKLLEQPTRS
jgi:hypothetical protein